MDKCERASLLSAILRETIFLQSFQPAFPASPDDSGGNRNRSPTGETDNPRAHDAPPPQGCAAEHSPRRRANASNSTSAACCSCGRISCTAADPASGFTQRHRAGLDATSAIVAKHRALRRRSNGAALGLASQGPFPNHGDSQRFGAETVISTYQGHDADIERNDERTRCTI